MRSDYSMKQFFFSKKNRQKENEPLLRGEEEESERVPTIRIINDSNQDPSRLHGGQNSDYVVNSPPDSPPIYDDLSALRLEPKPLKRRWAVLFVFFVLSVINNFMEFSFSPIAAFVMSYWSIDPFRLNILALVYMISGCTTRFFAMWIIDTIGLGIGTYIATALHLVGAWIRFWPGYYQDQYVWLLVGQIVTALAQAFIDITGPKLAANWFPPNERTTATAAGGGSIFVAALLSYAIAPRLVKSGQDMKIYLFVQAVVSTIAAIGIAAFFRGSPKIPPSYSAGQPKTSFWKAMAFLATNANFLILAFVFSITMSTGISILILLDQIVEAYIVPYSAEFASSLATVWIASCVFGGLLGGPIVDKTHAFKTVILTGLVLITASLLAFTFALEEVQQRTWVLYVIVSISGLGIVSMPAILEAAVEVIYPVPEATAMGILFFGLNVMSFFQALLIVQLRSPVYQFRIPLLISCGVCALTCVLVAFFKPKYERREFERVEKSKKTIIKREGSIISKTVEYETRTTVIISGE